MCKSTGIKPDSYSKNSRCKTVALDGCCRYAMHIYQLILPKCMIYVYMPYVHVPRQCTEDRIK